MRLPNWSILQENKRINFSPKLRGHCKWFHILWFKKTWMIFTCYSNWVFDIVWCRGTFYKLLFRKMLNLNLISSRRELKTMFCYITCSVYLCYLMTKLIKARWANESLGGYTTLNFNLPSFGLSLLCTTESKDHSLRIKIPNKTLTFSKLEILPCVCHKLFKCAR